MPKNSGSKKSYQYMHEVIRITFMLQDVFFATTDDKIISISKILMNL